MLNGFELARQAKLMRPHINIIYLSGYPVEGARGSGPDYVALLKKPLRVGDLLAEVSSHLH